MSVRGSCLIQDITAGPKMLAGSRNGGQAVPVRGPGNGGGRDPTVTLVLKKLVCTSSCYQNSPSEVDESFYIKTHDFWQPNPILVAPF